MVNAKNVHAQNGDVITQIDALGATVNINWSQAVRAAMARFGLTIPEQQVVPPQRPNLRVVR